MTDLIYGITVRWSLRQVMKHILLNISYQTAPSCSPPSVTYETFTQTLQKSNIFLNQTGNQ